MPDKNTEATQALRDLFLERFDDEELVELAFMLGVDFERDIKGDTVRAKAREFAGYIVRREWLPRLAEIGPRVRSDVPWNVVLKGYLTQGFLTDEDRDKLIHAIARTYGMDMGPGARSALLTAANLGSFAVYIELAQAPIHVARDIVAQLEPFGILPKQPSYHALGALLDYVLRQSDTPPQDARLLAELLIKYQLIADPTYLERLKTEYLSRDVSAVRQIDPALLSPSPTLAEVGPRERTDVDSSGDPKESLTRGFLTAEDRDKLIVAIAETYDIQLGPGARSALLDRAGLRNFALTIDLAQAPIHLARDIVARLEPYGILPSQPSYHALGALIDLIRQQPDTPLDDARFLAEVLINYKLVADSAYLDKLKAEYLSHDVSSVGQVDPRSSSPPPKVASDVSASPQAEAKPEGAQAAFVYDLVDIAQLAGAIYTAQAVARIEKPVGQAYGTGFLVGLDLLLTANYVIKSADALKEMGARFDYWQNVDGVASPGRVFEFQPDFYVGSPDNELDFALVRLKGEPLAEFRMQPSDEGQSHLELLRRGRHRGYLLVSPALIREGESLNLVHHAEGKPLTTTFGQALVDMNDTRTHYRAETFPGSGGAPVLNRRWEVVALHHAGGAHPSLSSTDPLLLRLRQKLIGMKFKEGIPMRAILPMIERYLPRN